jgi:hypothetical protein
MHDEHYLAVTAIGKLARREQTARNDSPELSR